MVQIYQRNSETKLKHKSWATKISVDSLIYIKELTKIIGLDHHASGWLSIQAKGKFEGIGALLGNDDKNKALYKKLYGFSFGDDIEVFDVIINTDNLAALEKSMNT